MFTYEIVYCAEDGETVIGTFVSEFSDLTSYDERTPIAIGSQEYIRLKDD